MGSFRECNETMMLENDSGKCSSIEASGIKWTVDQLPPPEAPFDRCATEYVAIVSTALCTLVVPSVRHIQLTMQDCADAQEFMVLVEVT